MASKPRWIPIARLSCMLAALSGAVAYARSRGALWDVVHALCVPDKAITGLPAPCTLVDRAAGIAVLKDVGSTGYLLVPTRRTSGVEDAQLLQPGSPNYWLPAWNLGRFVARRARRPLARDELAMAVNAIIGRTQDQLHIHVDCVRPEVRDTLRREGPNLGPDWGTITLLGHAYRVRRMTDAELVAHDPFKLVADSDPARPVTMGDQTIALAGALLQDGRPGFYLLAARATPANKGHGEELLDHGCALPPERRGSGRAEPSTHRNPVN